MTGKSERHDYNNNFQQEGWCFSLLYGNNAEIMMIDTGLPIGCLARKQYLYFLVIFRGATDK